MHFRVFSSISGFHPLDANSTHPPSPLWQQKMSSHIAKCPLQGQKQAWLRTTALYLPIYTSSPGIARGEKKSRFFKAPVSLIFRISNLL